MRNKRISNIDFIIIGITIISIIGVIFSIGLFIRDAFLETQAIETEAKILSIDYENKQRYAVVHHEIDGANYVLSIPMSTSQEELAVGDNLTFKYNKNNPGAYVDNEHLIEVLIVAFASLAGIIITTNKTISILRDLKYLKDLKINGITLNANISDVYVDINSPKKHGEFPYRIRAKYLNPQDNKEYVFDSEYTYKNLKELTSKSDINTIKVYLDKNNTNIYYVDLNNLIKEAESTKVEHENSIQPIDSKESIEEENE